MEEVPGQVRSVQRRTLLKALGAAGALAGLIACTDSSAGAAAAGSTSASATPTLIADSTPATTATAASTAAATPSSTTAATSTSAAPPVEDSGQITAAGVERALKALPDIIERDRKATKVPGVAVAVVHDGKVRYLAGSGLRAVGRTEKVDADTVFYLASVSKPISSTVIAAALTKKAANISWESPVAGALKGFTLSDPWVGSHVTVADMFSHRSGLPDHAGNLLEDLGFNREETIAKLAQYPLGSFRDSYEYTNYGLTAAAEAVAVASKRPWATLANDMIFKPLGMTSTSYTYAALKSRRNRVALHQKVKDQFVAAPDADYEPQAPAGSASSSVRDMATWATMLLAEGKAKGATLIDEDELIRVWAPAFLNHPPQKFGGWGSFYGYGWNVKYEMTGEQQVSHSGAFARGAATAVSIYPADKLAIVVLTNAAPVGVAEAISAEFIDFVRYGAAQQDWLEFVAPFFAEEPTADQVRYAKPAAAAKPARALASYVGTYQNAAYGPLTVTLVGKALSLTAGPKKEQHPLRHYSGDDFFFETTGEDATGFSGAVFGGSGSRITSVTVNAWNRDKLGVFTRR